MFSLMENIPARLITAGRIFINEDEEFMDHVEKHENVEFRGSYTRNGMVDIFNQSNAALLLFLPIKNHLISLPNKLFEYMAGGLPILASNIPAWKPIFEKYSCGLQVDLQDPNAVEEAACYLMNNRDEAREMGRKGKEAVKKEFNWSAEFKKLTNLYEQITHSQ